MNTALVIAALSIPVALNVWATWLVLADPDSTRTQRTAQLALIWLLPFIGAVVTLGVHRSAEKHSKKYRTESDPGDDYTLSGKFVQRTADALDHD